MQRKAATHPVTVEERRLRACDRSAGGGAKPVPGEASGLAGLSDLVHEPPGHAPGLLATVVAQLAVLSP